MRVYAIFSAVGEPVAFYNDDVFPPIVEPIEEMVPNPDFAPTENDATNPVPPMVPRVVGSREIGPNPALPANVTEITEEQWGEFIRHPGRRRWQDGAVVPYDPPPLPPTVPDAITDRQFAQALAERGTITWAEAQAWGSRGDVPAAFGQALAKLSDIDRNRASMFLGAATVFERQRPIVRTILRDMGWTNRQIDQFWTFAATL